MKVLRVLVSTALVMGACQASTPGPSRAFCDLEHGCNAVDSAGGVLVTVPTGTTLDRTALNIPAGAVTASLKTTLELVEPALGNEAAAALGSGTPLLPLGLTLRLGPDGTTFAKPISVTLAFDPGMLPYEASAADLIVAVQSHGPGGAVRWEALKPTSVSLADGVAVVSLSHFSDLTVAVPKPRVTANANYQLFHGLDDAAYSSDQQEARLRARCSQLVDVVVGYPGVRWQNPDISRLVGLVKLAPGTDLSHMLRGQNIPSADDRNQFFALTSKAVAPGDPQGRTYDQVLHDSILAAKTQLRPADVLRLALRATAGDYQLAVLTAHNVIKEQTYGGRDSVFGVTTGPDPRALFASKLENLRRDPNASDTVSADKMGPWYHTFGVLFVAGSIGPITGEALVDTEHITRLVSKALPDWWANIPLLGRFKSSPLDLGKAAVDNCMLDAAVKLDAAAKAAALNPSTVAVAAATRTVTIQITPTSSVLSGGTPVAAGLDLTPYVSGMLSFTVTGTLVQTDAQKRVYTHYPDGVQCGATACAAAPANGGDSPTAEFRSASGAAVPVTQVGGYTPRWSGSVWFPIKPSPFSTFAVPIPTGPFSGGPYEIPAGAATLVFGAPVYVLQNATRDTFSSAFAVTITVRPK